MRLSAFVGTIAAAALVAGNASAAGITLTSGPTIPDCGGQALSPASITLACGDGNYGLSGFAWQHWGAATAFGNGAARANDCTPDCAAGKFHTYNVLASASAIRTCRSGRKQYTLLVLHYLAARPKGIGATDTWKFPCDVTGPGPTLTGKVVEVNQLLVTGTGWQSRGGCSSSVSVGFSDRTKPFAARKVGSTDRFVLRLVAIRAGTVLVARQECATGAPGPRLYESTLVVK